MDRFYSFAVTSSILIVVIILLRALFVQKISMRLQYGMWLLVAVKLLVCPVPYLESSLSVQNLLEPWETMMQQRVHGADNENGENGIKSTQMDISDRQKGGGGDSAEAGQTGRGMDEDVLTGKTGKQTGANGSAGQKERNGTETGRFFAGVAVAGSLWMFVYFLAGNLRLGMYLHKKRIRWAQNGCPLPVYIAEGLPSPCLYGRAVYITPELAADEPRLLHVLVHEYCHYRQGDLIWALVRCLCLIICWWNPLVWLAAYLSKQDCELACDEAAVAFLGKDERLAYGRTLVSLIMVKADLKDCFSISASMTRGGRSMKRRIQRIAHREKTVGSVCILAVFLAVMCFVSVSTVRPSAEPARSDLAEDFSADGEIRQGDLAENRTSGQEVPGEEPGSGQETLDAEKAGGRGNPNTEKASGVKIPDAEKAGGRGNPDTEKAGGVKTPDTEKAGGHGSLEADEERVITDLDEAIGQAVLSYQEGGYLGGECAAEGHIKLYDEQRKDGHVTVYALTMYGQYEFHDDFFVKESGTGVIPAVMDFSYDGTSGYVLEDYQEPMDGGYYLDSIHELFPEHLWESCISVDDETIAALTEQERSHAEQYLKKIGRKAEAGDYRDHEHPLLTDAGVSVEVSNKLYELEKEGLWKYPDWIGSRERIEDGVRYVYEMALDKQAGEIVYTKRVYDTGETVERFMIDMYTGEEL